MARSKWNDVKENLILVQGWARNGLANDQIAKNLGISIQTFYTYQNEHIEFLDAIKKGKEVTDFEVENALFKKALSGDTTAQIFWLKNRKPAEWRDRRELDQTIGNKEGQVFKVEFAGEIEEWSK